MTFPLADEILRRLIEADGQPVSGQRIARAAGVTRAAVWKGVGVLRSQGYPVESVPAQGYRLTAGAGGVRPGAVSARLKTVRLGRHLRHLEEADSTNRQAEQWALAGAPEGALVLAEHQRGGRGRLKRSWFDLPRKSLLFSFVLRPDLPAAQAPTLTFAAAIALADSLSSWIDENLIEIKWPNDVLIAGRKVAGILLEMRCEGQRVEHVILGVGVNVAGTPEEFPPEVRGSTTTIEAHAVPPPSRLDVLCAFLSAFEDVYDRFLQEGFPHLQPRWNRWFRRSGQWLRVRTAGGVVEGWARGLGPGGALVLDPGNGPTLSVLAGDVETGSTRAA